MRIYVADRVDVLVGYVYRPIRTLLWYYFVVGILAAFYAYFGIFQHCLMRWSIASARSMVAVVSTPGERNDAA